MEQYDKLIYRKHAIVKAQNPTPKTLTRTTSESQNFKFGPFEEKSQKNFKVEEFNRIKKNKRTPTIDIPPIDFGCCSAQCSQSFIPIGDIQQPIIATPVPQEEIVRVTLIGQPMSYLHYRTRTISRSPVEPERARKRIPLSRLQYLKKNGITKLKPKVDRPSIVFQPEYANAGSKENNGNYLDVCKPDEKLIQSTLTATSSQMKSFVNEQKSQFKKEQFPSHYKSRSSVRSLIEPIEVISTSKVKEEQEDTQY